MTAVNMSKAAVAQRAVFRAAGLPPREAANAQRAETQLRTRIADRLGKEIASATKLKARITDGKPSFSLGIPDEFTTVEQRVILQEEFGALLGGRPDITFAQRLKDERQKFAALIGDEAAARMQLIFVPGEDKPFKLSIWESELTAEQSAAISQVKGRQRHFVPKVS